MKKVFISLLAYILFAVAFVTSACGDDRSGTYYPPNEEMKTNLESAGYTVVIYQDLSDNDGKQYDGTLLFASRSREGEREEYLYFYRLTSAEACNYYYSAMEANCKNYNSLVSIENDDKFGYLVYCGTENAVNAAGIRVVQVKVGADVKV